MEQYVKKSAIAAEIRKYKNNAEAYLKYHHNRNDKLVHSFEQEKLRMCELLSFIDTLDAKEIDLEEEIDKELYEEWYGEYIDYNKFRKSAKHFFELGMSVSNSITATDRGTAEEIIINLKRVEKDYHIDLTREIEWLRNKVKKVE